MIGHQRCVTLILEPFEERLAPVWLVPLVGLVLFGLSVCFVLVVLLFNLEDFIPKFGHFFHLDVALGSLV